MLFDLGEAYQNIEIAGDSKKQELVKPVEMLVEGQCFKEQDLYFDRQMNQQLLEKNMRLTAIQSLIQKLKVKFLYSKRKQPIKKIRLRKTSSIESLGGDRCCSDIHWGKFCNVCKRSL